MTRIDFRQVRKRYAPGMPLTINNANLEIGCGEFCVFVGPSGCGKSTLLRMDARALPSGAAVQLGVRPEHLIVADVGEGAGLPAVLRHVEHLGEASLLYVDAGGGLPLLTVRIEGTARQAVGQQLTLRLRPEQLHLFDGVGQGCPRVVELPC